jgi:Flp pilus assembly protein TadG
LVEAALVIPFLLLVLMGMIDFARAFSARITLNNAVSEGALYAAQFPDNYLLTQQRVVDAGADLNLVAGDVTVTCDTSLDPEQIQVEATTEVAMLTYVGQWLGSSITLMADSVAINTQSAACQSSP